MKKIFLIVVLSLCMLSPTVKSIEVFSWYGWINEANCKPTISGNFKRLFGELKFWDEVSTSMAMWDTEYKRKSWCYNYWTSKDKLEKCLEPIKIRKLNLDKCYPIVIKKFNQIVNSK